MTKSQKSVCCLEWHLRVFVVIKSIGTKSITPKIKQFQTF